MRQLKKGIMFLLIISALVVSPGARAQEDMFNGKPVFAEGADLGYYVWKEGRKWHVRWTTMGRLRRFTGSVVAEGGKLKSLKRIDVESERRVLYPGRSPQVVYGPRGRRHVSGGRAPVVVERKQDVIEKDGDYRIVFRAATNNDIDGFDFSVDDNVKSLRFVLQIDGQSLPRNVEIGKENRKAVSLPLVAVL